MFSLAILLLSGAAGAAVGRLLRLPMWPITGALVGSATANLITDTSIVMPFELSFAAQVLVGTAVGASVLPGFGREVGRLIVPALVVVLTLVSVGISAGIVMNLFGFLQLTEALFGMVPGGVGEMVAAASVLSADSALVAGIHVIRLLVSLWTLPVLMRWASTWQRPGSSR